MSEYFVDYREDICRLSATSDNIRHYRGLDDHRDSSPSSEMKANRLQIANRLVMKLKNGSRRAYGAAYQRIYARNGFLDNDDDLAETNSRRLLRYDDGTCLRQQQMTEFCLEIRSCDEEWYNKLNMSITADNTSTTLSDSVVTNNCGMLEFVTTRCKHLKQAMLFCVWEIFVVFTFAIEWSNCENYTPWSWRIFKGKKTKLLYLRNGKSLLKNVWESFDVCHRMVSLLKLYFVTLANFL